MKISSNIKNMIIHAVLAVTRSFLLWVPDGSESLCRDGMKRDGGSIGCNSDYTAITWLGASFTRF